jgi:CMP-N-acetylneuraminic acid synthetase
MRFVAIVTARKGSKSIKKKNLLEINKKPLIEYTFKELLKSKIGKNAYVVTDDDIIKKISKKYKINTEYFRPKKTSTDKSSSIETIHHFAKWLLKKKDFDAIISLQPTSPLRNFKDIDKAVNLFQKKNFDSLFSISESLEHPYETIDFKKSEKKIFFTLKKSQKFFRRQDYDINSFFINGAIYIFKKELILKKKIYSKNNHGFYIMPKLRSLDVNDLEDIEIMKSILK